jgi:hypothetical protein
MADDEITRNGTRAAADAADIETNQVAVQPQPPKQPAEQPQANRIMDLFEGVELFHTPEGVAYVSIESNGHRENWPLKHRRVKDWIRQLYYSRHRHVVNPQTIDSVVSTLEGQASFDGPEIPVHVRVAQLDDTLYLDLANDAWECVAVTSDCWWVESDPPVRFRRPSGMRPLPRPVKGGDLGRLRDFINVGTEDDLRLMVGWLVAALRPNGPHLILQVTGEQGSAKSTACRVLVDTFDPKKAPLRSMPRNSQDLMITAQNGHVVGFDNLSSISVKVSDDLCRLATGGGLGTRALYTDDEEKLFDAQRPILLNGIGDVVTRGDLQDRTITVNLPVISENERRPEEQFWAEFEAEHPQLLGALLDAISTALYRKADVRIQELPRMADAVIWVTAAEPALRWREGSFLKAFEGNRELTNQAILEASPVATEILSYLEEFDSWVGTATELLTELNKRVPRETQRSRGWPNAPYLVSRQLKRLAPILRSAGVGVEFAQTGGSNSRKLISLFRKPSDATDASDAQDGEGVAGVAGVGKSETSEEAEALRI